MDIYLVVERIPGMYESETDSVNLLGVFNDIQSLLKNKYNKDTQVLMIPEKNQNEKLYLDLNSSWLTDSNVQDLGNYQTFYKNHKHLLIQSEDLVENKIVKQNRKKK